MLHVCACVSVWRLENSPQILFLTGLELASKSQESSCLRLTSAGITSTCPDAGFVLTWVLVPLTTLASMFLSELSFLLPQRIFFIFTVELSPDSRPPHRPHEDGDRGILPAATLSLSAPAHSQELSKAPSTKSMAERSKSHLVLRGFPLRNGNKIWLVRRREPVLRELVSGTGRKCALWRVCL